MVQLQYRLHNSGLPNFSHFKLLTISKFGVPQSVASIHSLQFPNSCRPYLSIPVIFPWCLKQCYYLWQSEVQICICWRILRYYGDEQGSPASRSAVRPASQRYAGHEEAHSLLVPIPAPLTRLRSSLKCTKDYIALCEEEGTKWPACCEIETAVYIVNAVITNCTYTNVHKQRTNDVGSLFCFVNVFEAFGTNWNSSNWWTNKK